MNNTFVTNEVKIGGKGQTRSLVIGGKSPVSIQTMWKSSLIGANLDEIVRNLYELEVMGCDIVRFAVPDAESAEQLVKLSKLTPMPLVADIHFDHTLALRCLDGTIAKVRINPGNIGSKDRVSAVLHKAKDTNTAIRIGLNTGSLPSNLQTIIKTQINEGSTVAEARAFALVQAAEREIEIFDSHHFNDYIVSMKSSSVLETIRANEIFAKKFNAPLHLGVTEAGPLIGGIVKSALAFSKLFEQNIGATVRVSLSDSLENEVIAAREILTECGKRSGGVRIVSCPRCGRDGFDVHGFVARWQKELLSLKKDITVAIMGCVVNGPGEGKHADIGITGAGNSVLIFKKGKIVRTITIKNDYTEADKAFREELDSL